MIHAVRYKERAGAKAKRQRRRPYITAVCDGCQNECEASRQFGRHNIGLTNAAIAAALALGWVERRVRESSSKKGRPDQVIHLLCPACQAKAEPITEGPRS